MLMIVSLLLDSITSIARLTLYFPLDNSGVAFNCSNHRSFNSRAAAANRGSFLVTFFSFGSAFSSMTEGTVALNRKPPTQLLMDSPPPTAS